MHPVLFLLLCVATLGLASYGVTLIPMQPQPKQIAHLGLVILFLVYVSQHFGLF